MSIFLLAIGGGIGALLRYILGKKIQENSNFNIPVNTMLINILGSFFLGLSVASIQDHNLSAFFQTGILGAFTTFSTFLLEAFELLKEDGFISMLKYLLPTIILGLLAFLMGAKLFF